MAETSAGITLGLEAALDYVVAAAKLGERIERDLDAAVEGAEIAGHRIFERRRTRREAGAAQRGGEDCVAGAGARVQRLGHGSEIGREPAGLRRRDAEHVGNVLARDPDEARAGHGGPHGADTAHRMPTADQGLLGRGSRELQAHFEADNEGRRHFGGRRPGVLGERQQRRNDRRGRLA